MINVSVACDPSGAFELNDRLAGLAADPAGPMGDAMRDAGTVYLDAMAQRFAGASAGDGTWEPRKDGGPILMSDGSLYRSLFPGGSNNVLRVYADGVAVGVEAGTADPVAKFHQFGTPRLPKREIIVEPDATTRQRIDAAVAAGLRNLIVALRGGV